MFSSFGHGKNAVIHLFRRGLAGKAKSHRFLKILAIVRNEVDSCAFCAQYILRRIRAIAALQHHCVVILARNIVRKAQRIRAEIGLPVFADGRNKRRWHRVKRRRLVKRN